MLQLLFLIMFLKTIDLSVSFGGFKTSAKNHRYSLGVLMLPWKRDDSTVEKILVRVDNLATIVEELRSTNANLISIVADLRLNSANVTASVVDLRSMLMTTQSTVANILAGITIAVTVIGAAKTLFESIEYIPTIPSKISRIVEEGKAQNLEKKYESLRKEFRQFQEKSRKTN